MGGRLLVAYGNASNYVPTTAEYLASIARYSDWDVRYVHVTHGAEITFDLNDYDALFQSYCARLPEGRLSPDFIGKLRQFRGLKVLSIQDEYERTETLRRAIREIGYHAVLTCMPPAMIERIFPRRLFPATDFITVLTGYVPESLAGRGDRLRRLQERPICIGYRGRDVGARYGKRAFEKVEIGRRVREICAQRGISHDIEWTEDKRLYGEAWYDFIASCRANLGSETGSNVFDFDGSIETEYERLAALLGGPVPHEEFRAYTDPVESQYDTGLISPRLFEAAALRTPMILFTGQYSGLIQPDEHYIELKKDFSNIDAVIARLEDLEDLERLADRAFDRLVGSGDFSYLQFVKLVDTTISRKAAELGSTLRPPLRDDPGTVEIGADLEVLTSRGERPTEAPRHPVFFRYKSLAWENGDLKSEITRLTRFYANEITHINDAYQAEIARLNDTYSAQINQLNQEIERIHGVYKAEIAELHAVYKAEIAELHAVYKAEIARLREVISEVRARLYWLIFIYRLYKRGAAGIGAFGQTLRKRAGSLPSIDSFWSPAWLPSAKRRSKLQPEDQDFEIR
jgi:hypothetical protein